MLYKIFIILVQSNRRAAAKWQGFVQHIECCAIMNSILTEGEDMPIISDEAPPPLDGHVYVQNCKYWTLENPRE